MINEALVASDHRMATDPGAARRRRLAVGLLLAGIALALAGLAAGSDGWSLPWHGDADSGLILGQIRAPRTLGAWMVGALLGLAGAIAQGLFRNPLADPYLLARPPVRRWPWCWRWRLDRWVA